MYINEGDKAGQALALNNLGIVLYSKGDGVRALEHYQRSLKLKEEMGDREGQASTLNNIGYINEQNNNYRQGLEYYERCLSYFGRRWRVRVLRLCVRMWSECRRA